VGSRVAGTAVVAASVALPQVDFLPWNSPRFYWEAVYNNFGGVCRPDNRHESYLD
jgi:hypothetical protein